jgi:hypothetical protein
MVKSCCNSLKVSGLMSAVFFETLMGKYGNIME